MPAIIENHYQVVIKMYVCVCNAVTDREIKKAVKQGDDTFEKVRDSLKVASCCGQCESHAREVIAEAKQAKPTLGGIPLFPVDMPCPA
ncbi:MAG: (2Fe-2S)-binding protein [Thiolinea sp.]